MKRPRRNHFVAFKAKVALAAVRGDKTLAELADGRSPSEPDSPEEPVARARRDHVFGGEAPAPDSAATIRALQAKIGQLAMECDFLEGALNKTGLGSAKR